jgi:Ca2+-binding RTX toxin-like protein
MISDDARGSNAGEGGNNVFEGGENSTVHHLDGIMFNGERIEASGDDIIYGGTGDDRIYADRMALLADLLDPATPMLDMLGDWISAGLGEDRVYGSAAHDALFGGGGADVILGGAGNDVLDGDDHYQTNGFPFWKLNEGEFGVEFFPVTNIYDALYPIEYYRDYGGGDVLDGGTGDDVLLGMLGDDLLIGGVGLDRLEGWEGDDQLYGGAGDDILAGDFGRYEVIGSRLPLVAYHVAPGAIAPYMTAAEADQIGNDFLDGGAGDDQMYGDAGDDTLLGWEGADVIYGDANYVPDEWHGHDFVDGGDGADSLFGGSGNDQLFGGADGDWITGGHGPRRRRGRRRLHLRRGG